MKYAYFILAVLLTMTIGTGIASAQVYKWVDENGKVHYGDKPQEGVKAQTLRLRRTPNSARNTDDSGEESGADASSGDSSFMERRTEKKMAAENRQKDADREAALKRYCSALNERLRVLTSGQPLKTINAKGETEWYDEARTKREVAKAKQDYAQKCAKKK